MKYRMNYIRKFLQLYSAHICASLVYMIKCPCMPCMKYSTVA